VQILPSLALAACTGCLHLVVSGNIRYLVFCCPLTAGVKILSRCIVCCIAIEYLNATRELEQHWRHDLYRYSRITQKRICVRLKSMQFSTLQSGVESSLIAECSALCVTVAGRTQSRLFNWHYLLPSLPPCYRYHSAHIKLYVFSFFYSLYLYLYWSIVPMPFDV
jgi:hypothetical protein